MKKCGCTKDLDGQCQTCRAKLLTGVNALAGAVREFQEKSEDLIREFDERSKSIRAVFDSGSKCDGCAKKYVDFVMSRMISLVLADAERSVAERVFSIILGKLGKHMKKRPLTEKAWADLCKRRGWKERKS